jgi:hypothetical protein
VALVESLCTADLAGFMKSVSEDPKLLNARGEEGSTPFMYAVLYTGKATLERLLKLGADPNKRNDANATALMWAAADSDKTRVPLAHGADVNAFDSLGRTPLMYAASSDLLNFDVVKLLVERGADINARDADKNVRNREILVRLADRWSRPIRPHLCARRWLPAEHPAGGRDLVRQNARPAHPAVLRCGLPARVRSVDFRRRNQLGGVGSFAGRIPRAIVSDILDACSS